MAPNVRPGESAVALGGQVTLWTRGTSEHAIECLAQRHPLGLELCYVMNDRIVMRRVFDSWDRLFSQAVLWRDELGTPSPAAPPVPLVRHAGSPR
jgi:hypothetical protein